MPDSIHRTLNPNPNPKYVNSSTAESASFAQTQRNLTRDVIQALDALQHMEMALVALERDRDQFTHVGANELQRRRSHCAAVRREIRKVKTKLHSKSTVLKIDADKRKVLVARRCQTQLHSNGSGFGCTRAGTKDGFFKGHRREQQIFRERQDVQLTDLERGVSVLGQAADTIHDELIEQDMMLDEVKSLPTL